MQEEIIVENGIKSILQKIFDYYYSYKRTCKTVALGELLPLATAGGNGLMPKNQFEPILENTDSRGTWISIASLKTTGATGQSACTITLLLSGDNDYTTNQQNVAIVGLSSRPKLSCSISVLSGSKPIIGYTTDGGLHTIWMRRYPWRSFFSIKTLVKDNANIDINKMSYDEPNGIIYF
ncbi:hypothetical protein PL596_16685 [Phocaeicola vulgatus]|nr:hypothetical protein [Phocaeicola vulgatus]MDB0880960.1 hypothetical protein [Phocaeicola vulgatus]MDB0895907.1 hypothetical protein [Phocaeicola vulgatus]MDB0908742.1 hypothetical protein [Phocaeicola vulgatus]MDB0913085.1 hypothetical protein [Phocaeicola vulgatus]